MIMWRRASCRPELGFDLDADRFEEIIGQDAAGTDDDRIIAQPHFLVGLLQNDFLRSNFPDLGIEQHFELAFGARSIDALTVAQFGALERLAAIREIDLCTAKLG